MSQKPLPHAPRTVPDARKSLPEGTHIVLALSGGGFRATLFHLGVMRFLNEVNRLKDVAHVCSVSGGSVLAAHFALHREDYVGDTSQFDRRASDIFALVRRDVRGRVARRWLLNVPLLGLPILLGTCTRSKLLESSYQELFENATRTSLTTACGLSVLATSLTTGGVLAFGRDGVTLFTDSTPISSARPRHVEFAVAHAVAASSAFTPVFPPFSLPASQLGFSKDDRVPDHMITDGGLYDNLGIRVAESFLRGLPNATDRASILIVSDAGRPFDWTTDDEGCYSLVLAPVQAYPCGV